MKEEFLKNINDIVKENEKNQDNKKIFFRGQANKEWEIMPNIFRNNLIGLEHKLIEEAEALKANEISKCSNKFEILTVLQHYELGTRLLDITTNPLVALYFACCDEEEKDGVVYYATEYPTSYNSFEIKVLTRLVEFDASSKVDITNFIKCLKDDKIISNNFNNDKIIDILKENYFVTSNITNSRLQRQSGAFLIPGLVNVYKEKEKYFICKAKSSLRNVFNQKMFIINKKSKFELLKTLDMFNINEATLFPELEHQMKYIRWKMLQII